jgi:membrane protein
MKQRSVNISARKPLPYTAACASLLALIAVSLAWELWIAPLREGGSWLALKALPLCLPLSGILKGRVYTYQYSSMLVLIYFAEAVMRLFDAAPAGRLCAAAATVCCTVFFVSCMAFVKQKQKEARHG